MQRSGLLLGSLVVLTGLAAACGEDGATRRPRTGGRAITESNAPINDPRDPTKEKHPDLLEGLPHGSTQIEALCARSGSMDESNPSFNAVTNAFCKEGRSPSSLVELREALGLAFRRGDRSGTNGSNGNPGFALLGHSSSLVARSVSAVNPRAFVFSAPSGQPTRIPGFVVMGFVRGEPLVEIAAEQGNGGKITFYLVKFDLACEPDCSPADLLTPAVERDWKGVTVYDDEDLKNTMLDCRHCHQPDGPSGKMMLRMQELEDPWTHWFRSDRPGGLALMQDYFRAHSDEEEYGSIPGALIPKSDGRALEDLVKGQGFNRQPNEFDSRAIEDEITLSSSMQPEINTPRGRSSTWQELYDRAFRGEFIPPPYHDVKVTDPNKLQYVTDEYKKFMAGEVQTLPDIRRVFLDDALEAMTFLPRSGAAGREVLVQTCAQCHNPKLDQTISRAKFDVTRLDSMSRAAKDEAIKRLKLPASDRLHMPPGIMRALPDDALQAAVSELEK